MPNDKGEQRRQAVGGNAEGQVPSAAPADQDSPAEESASAGEEGAAIGTVTLADCLAEIEHALNYWYPLKHDASREECDARHVRLFEFRDRLKRQLNGGTAA